MADDSRFTALHIGDLHFWAVPRNPLLLLGKRALGVGNLLLGGRARRFCRAEAPRLARRLEELSPDALLFSGDFTTTSLPEEFRLASRVLRGAVQRATAGAWSVPGNHDCYIRREITGTSYETHLGAAFRPESDTAAELLAGKILLLRLNAATSNGFGSFGRIGEHHLSRVAEILANLDSSVRWIWLMCHFPGETPAPLLRHKRSPQLRNSESLLKLLGACGLPVLWLHGHDHHRWIYRSPTTHNVVYLNAGAPLMRRGGAFPDLGFHEVCVDGAGELSVRTHQSGRSAGAGWTAKDVGIPQQAGQYVDLQ